VTFSCVMFGPAEFEINTISRTKDFLLRRRHRRRKQGIRPVSSGTTTRGSLSPRVPQILSAKVDLLASIREIRSELRLLEPAKRTSPSIIEHNHVF